MPGTTMECENVATNVKAEPSVFVIYTMYLLKYFWALGPLPRPSSEKYKRLNYEIAQENRYAKTNYLHAQVTNLNS